MHTLRGSSLNSFAMYRLLHSRHVLAGMVPGDVHIAMAVDIGLWLAYRSLVEVIVLTRRKPTSIVLS